MVWPKFWTYSQMYYFAINPSCLVMPNGKVVTFIFMGLGKCVILVTLYPILRKLHCWGLNINGQRIQWMIIQRQFLNHRDVPSTPASQITGNSNVCLVTIKEDIKASVNSPWWWEFAVDPWIMTRTMVHTCVVSVCRRTDRRTDKVQPITNIPLPPIPRRKRYSHRYKCYLVLVLLKVQFLEVK